LAVWHPEYGDDLVAALDLDLVDQGVKQPLAGWGRPIGYRDAGLFGEVG
jgi:hypothetical protein